LILNDKNTYFFSIKEINSWENIQFFYWAEFYKQRALILTRIPSSVLALTQKTPMFLMMISLWLPIN